MIVSGLAVILCTLAGLAGGIWVASEIPPAPGLAAMVTCLFGVIVVLFATVAGAGVGIGIAVALAERTARSGDG
jgi:hypothetical protein